MNIPSKNSTAQTDLYKLNQNGTLDNVNHYEWTRPGGKRKQPIEPVSKYKPYITAFSPPPYDWAWRRYDLEISNYSRDYPIPLEAITGIIRESRPLNTPINLLISIAIMGFTLWHGLARRTSWAKLIFWVILDGASQFGRITGLLGSKPYAGYKMPGLRQKTRA